MLDNLELSNVGAAVVAAEKGTILAASAHIDLWASGCRYNGTSGGFKSGAVDAPPKDKSLLDKSGKLFYRRRPQYEKLGADQFLMATRNGCKNEGTGDNTNAVNAFLQKAWNEGKIAYFPAGIYRQVHV